LSYSALHGFLPDCNPGAGCDTSARSIFSQVKTWKAYDESMPSDCDRSNSGQGEGGGYGSGEHCATNTKDVSCHLATLVISPSTRAGTRSGTLFNHYSLLGTAEQLLGVSKLGLAGAYPTMTKPFNL
jgi:hypothetical protein